VKFDDAKKVLPVQRIAVFNSVDPTEVSFDLDNVLGQPTTLKAGMGGHAEVVIAKRLLISIAFDPIRQLRENMVSPPDQRRQPSMEFTPNGAPSPTIWRLK
jgi:hypothetical protein